MEKTNIYTMFKWDKIFFQSLKHHIFNPYAAVGEFCQYKIMQKSWKITETLGTHMRVLGESYLVNTNMTGFKWFTKIFALLCFWGKYKLSIGRVKVFFQNFFFNYLCYISSSCESFWYLVSVWYCQKAVRISNAQQLARLMHASSRWLPLKGTHETII